MSDPNLFKVGSESACERAALTVAYDQYHLPIYRYIYRQVGEIETARDLAAETFRHLLTAVNQGRGPHDNLKAWLYQTAHHLVIDYYRRQKHRNHLPLADDLIDLLPEPAMAQQLEQFQQMAQQQQQMLEQTDGNQVQAAVQTMIQARQAAEDGLVTPATFRYRYGQHRPDEAPPQPTPVPGSGRPATPTQAAEPTLAPTPIEVASPAAEPTLATTATAVRPRHTPPPTGDAHRYGPQPTQPGPGQSGGNPEGQNTPTGDANRYGPQPTQPGPGQPGGNPEATCTPTGDANRYGSPSATPQPGGNSGDSGGSDNSGGSGGSGDSGGGSEDTGGSGGSDNSGGSGGSSDSGGDSGDSGGSDDSGGSGGSSDRAGDSGGSGGSDSGSSGSDSGGSGGSGGGHK